MRQGIGKAVHRMDARLSHASHGDERRHQRADHRGSGTLHRTLSITEATIRAAYGAVRLPKTGVLAQRTA